jgi:hypothetical protein
MPYPLNQRWLRQYTYVVDDSLDAKNLTYNDNSTTYNLDDVNIDYTDEVEAYYLSSVNITLG